jgi:hypothetical protein
MKGFTIEKIGMLILGTLAAICIYVALTDSGCPHSKNTPTALDVYRGKTTLEITYRDSVAIDSTAVYKVK